ncbi:MAG: RNA polymerase sigma factor [Acidimicrobiales bacterium]|nr:RNA polymerase sigma factor [Acidimicrobiales bacterium]
MIQSQIILTDEKGMASGVGRRRGDENSFNPSFDAVLRAAQNGDGNAFDQLFTMLSRRIFAFLRVRGAKDPEGMVNDVFLSIFTNVSGFEGNEAQFQAWVFTIARNKLIDEGRKRQRRIDESLVDSFEDLGVPAGDVEDDAMGLVGNAWVKEQLGKLTSEQRDVVILRIVGDLTIETIADVLGKSIGATKAIQRRAFRSLARELSEEGVPL